MQRLSYTICAESVLTIVGEDYSGYSQGQQNQLAKRSTCKQKSKVKHDKLTNAQIDALLTKKSCGVTKLRSVENTEPVEWPISQ